MTRLPLRIWLTLLPLSLWLAACGGSQVSRPLLTATAATGCISGNCVNGHGTFVWKGGVRYEGQWSQNKMHGQGTYTWPSGETYTGTLVRGDFQGHGVKIWPSGNRYEGQWAKDKMNGRGTYTWKDGGQYVGEMKENKFTGHGVRTWPSGNRYEGQWADDKMNGQGTYTWKNGDQYVGAFRDSNFNGQGTKTWADGAHYAGNWKDDKRHGQGNFTWANGSTYVGAWQNDKRHGRGTTTWLNGHTFTGNYVDGKMEGQGTHIFPDGARFEGLFKQGEPFGAGKITTPGGKEFWGPASTRLQVVKTLPDGQAARLGFQPNDILFSYNLRHLMGKHLTGDPSALFLDLIKENAGNKKNVPMTLIRAGKKRHVSLSPGHIGLEYLKVPWVKTVSVEMTDAPQRPPPPVPERAVQPANLDFGRYHALVIGNNAYNGGIPRLKTAVRDAEGVAKLLGAAYGFKVKLLKNARRIDIITALSEYRKRLTPRDNLLIYYAGHGWLDSEADEGYWLPIDAERDNPANWVSTASLTAMARAMEAKHMMVVADSCYAGKLTRGLHLKKLSPGYLRKIARKKARVVLSSGGLEPVLDAGGGEHSVFAGAFIKALRSNGGVIDGTSLFQTVRRAVMLKADQTPEYADIRKAGHDGGDFLFVRK